MAAGQSSGTYDWKPSIAEWLIESYERIQVYAPSLTTNHIISARRSANIVLQDYSNRGLNLWEINQLFIPLPPGVATYTLPENVVDLLDCYIRTYSPSGTQTTLGNVLTPMTFGGVPATTAWGEPMTLGPGSGTLSAILGSSEITMHWPSHGLSVGSPVFLGLPASVGGIYLSGFYIADSIIDQDNFTFQAASSAIVTSPSPIGGPPQGVTPLFATTAGSTSVQVIIPAHGQIVGNSWPVQFATTVGGITIPAGTYIVASVPNAYTFTITATGAAATTDAQFENGGQIAVSGQQSGQFFPGDVLVYPISRNDYAAIPDKQNQGRPTTFWFDRQIVPRFTLWPVPPTAQNPQSIQPVFAPPSTNATNAANPNQFYGFVAYYLRAIQDANPVGGQVLDMPKRFFAAFTAELVAALSEKFKRELWAEKLAYAKVKWDEAAEEDREKVSFFASPDLSGYFRSSY